MNYSQLTILVPCHSLEDFPTELPEDQAAGLLNAFAVAWHPILLAAAKSLPTWDRSDDPPIDLEQRLVFVPSACTDWLPGGWVEHARLQGAAVVADVTDRSEMLQQALEPLGETAHVDPDLAADFLALGLCWLQTELLTRHMHHYSNLDEVHLRNETISAAESAVAGDSEAARQHLRNAFEELLQARERFYPVDCYVIDLCLLIPRVVEEQLAAFERLLDSEPTNFIATAEDWQAIRQAHPTQFETVRERWAAGRIDLAGGDLREAPLPVLPLGSVIWEFEEGRRVYQELFDRRPTVWGRRRYGLSTQLPQVLHKFDIRGVLHLVMDDGLYPEEDSSKIRWEGCDGTVIDAVCRFPLTAEGAASFLRFPVLMAESMEQDQAAAVLFARWPEVRSPWLDDFRRMNRYAAVLGKFVTLEEYFESTSDPGRLSAFDQREYLPPFFVQFAARQLPNPLSRFSGHTQRRHQFEAAQWCAAVAQVLQGRSVPDTGNVERAVELSNPDAEPEQVAAAETALAEFTPQAVGDLAQLVLHGGGSQAGLLLVNSLPTARMASVSLEEFSSPPLVGGAVKAVQFDDLRRVAVVELPGSGFVWLPANSPDPPKKKPDPPMVEEAVLRNEFFEVYINPQTGGIARIKHYGRSPNRLSQQLAYRFPRERSVPVGDTGEVERSYYSGMRCRDLRITSTGPALGEIITQGEIFDQADGSVLAEFTQTTRVWRHRRVVEVDVLLDLKKTPDAEPWTNYYAARFAWNDPTAALTRTVQQGAHGFRGERFESADYLEIASDEERTTILFHGLPFHRKTGTRMLDTLLITQGESQRRFTFSIAVDEPYPLTAAREALTPVLRTSTTSGPPRTGESGWFFHLNAKNVQVLKILPLAEDPASETPASGFALRLLETEGRGRQVKLRCFRTPKSARTRNFLGHMLSTLSVTDEVVLIPIGPHEIADVELRF